MDTDAYKQLAAHGDGGGTVGHAPIVPGKGNDADATNQAPWRMSS
jgi:hypothetical protein